MAPKKITGYVKLQIMAGKATPAPPVGPALGQAQVNIMEFCKQFNDRTKAPDLAGLTIPVVIRSEEHTSELQSHLNLVCRLLLEKKQLPPAIRPPSFTGLQ